MIIHRKLFNAANPALHCHANKAIPATLAHLFSMIDTNSTSTTAASTVQHASTHPIAQAGSSPTWVAPTASCSDRSNYRSTAITASHCTRTWTSDARRSGLTTRRTARVRVYQPNFSKLVLHTVALCFHSHPLDPSLLLPPHFLFRPSSERLLFPLQIGSMWLGL